MSTAVELFIIGIATSWGPCSFLCSPVILPYVAATKHGWRESLKAVLIFLSIHLLIYSLLGFLAGLFGGLITKWFYRFDYIVYLAGGIFISLLGLFIIFGKKSGHRLCQIPKKQVVDNSNKGTILLSFTTGILPCAPLLGALTYIALKTQNFWGGAFYGFAFGMGHFISPLIPLSILVGTLPVVLIKKHKIYSFFSRFCGFILFFLGVNLIVFGILR